MEENKFRNNLEQIESDKELQDFIDNAALAYNILEQGIVIYSVDGRVRFVNDFLKKVMGYSDDELIDKSFSSIYLSSEISLVSNQLLGVLEGNDSFSIDYSIELEESGEYSYVRKKLKSILNSDKNLIGILGVLEDTTEKEQIKEKFEESNMLLKMFVKDAPIYSFIKEIVGKESRVYMFSDKYREITGLDSSELKGKKMEEILPQEAAKEIIETDLLVYNEGKSISFEEKKFGKDFYTVKFPIKINKKTFVAGYSIDVSEMKNTEDELRTIKHLLLSIINGTTDLIYTKDLEGRYTLINKAFEKFAGKSKKEILGKNMTEVFDISKNNTSLLESDQRVINKEKLIQSDELLKDHNGEERKVIISKGPTYDRDGELTGVFGILSDETELKEINHQLELRQRMDSLGTLAGGIAHDFNNLLTGILGNLELATLDNDISDINLKYIKTAIKSSKRAGDLIRQLQNLSEHSESKKKQFDIYDVTSEAVNLLRRGVNPLINIDIYFKKGDFIIDGNEGEINQVLLNLGTNAKQAIEERSYLQDDFISIKAENAIIKKGHRTNLPEGEYVHILFEDSGIGMTEEIKNSAFDPLFTTKELGKDRGQGLGLAMVYKIIVNKHKGHISIESKEGYGTTFHIYIPKAVKQEEKEINNSVNLLNGSETILVVEDEDHIREIAIQILQIHGYNVITAIDGKDGFNKYIEFKDKIDLVLLDLSMPKMGGKELLENIVKVKKDINVIVASGLSREEGGIDKAKGFVSKPYTINSLLGEIRKVIDKT